ncbi:MAG: IdeS/Mac family cysteine endopeptidase, partial [Bacteroidales bacterium]|nr:IdeS/Mac family cysteine endopeptidase [Bacteroidales bacterium]
PERLARFSELLIEFMGRGTCGLGVSIGLGGGLHSITLWGCEYDNATGIVSKIWIADSDDIKSGPRTPILHECTISMEDGSIRIDGASQTYYITQLFPVSGYGSL